MVWPRLPAMPLVEATDTIRGEFRKCSEASSASLIRSCAAILTAITESQRPWSMLASSLSRVMPALWITMSRRPWRSTAWSMIRCPASSRLMSSCRAVPCTSLATAARWSPAAGMSTTTTVAPSRCRVRAIAAPIPRAAPVTTATLPASGFSASAGSCPSRGADGEELPVDERGTAGQEEPQRAEGAGAGGAGAVGEQDAVAGGAGAEFLGQRAEEPVHALPGRCGGRVAAGSAASAAARETVMTRAFGCQVPEGRGGREHRLCQVLRAGQFVQHQDDGAELFLGHRMPADVEVPGQEGRRPARRRRCRCPGPGRARSRAAGPAGGAAAPPAAAARASWRCPCRGRGSRTAVYLSVIGSP